MNPNWEEIPSLTCICHQSPTIREVLSINLHILHRIQTSKAAPQLKVTGVQAKPIGQSVAATGASRIMTFGQLNQDTMAGDLGKPKERRYHKETTIEMLQNIARNSDKCDKMPHIRGLKI